MMDFVFKMMDFVFKMMNFEGAEPHPARGLGDRAAGSIRGE